MAAPRVASAAALVKDTHPDANAEQVENAIKQGALEGELAEYDIDLTLKIAEDTMLVIE